MAFIYYRLDFLKRNIERACGTPLLDPSCANDLLATINDALREAAIGEHHDSVEASGINSIH